MASALARDCADFFVDGDFLRGACIGANYITETGAGQGTPRDRVTLM